MSFYEFSQNNSGGQWDVDDKLCHRVIIEADTYGEAERMAKDLGVYFDGCDKGLDCNCCGDRWYSGNIIDLNRINDKGYEVSVFDRIGNPEKLWQTKYGKYEIAENPKWNDGFAFRHFEGKIKFKDVEQYIQFLADEYGATKPDARIFYKNNTIKEILSKK